MKKGVWVAYGFTLVELLVVISIISILASIVLASTRYAGEKARDARRQMEIKQYGTLFESCYGDKGNYPDNIDIGLADSFWYSGSNYLWTGSCQSCWSHFLSYVSGTGCFPNFFMSDPVNVNPLSYYYFHFDPAAVYVTYHDAVITLNPACRGRYAFMTVLEDTISPNLNCFLQFQDPNQSFSTLWFVLGL